MANGIAILLGVQGAGRLGAMRPVGAYSILKLTPIHAVVAVRGNTTVTIPLTALKCVNETVGTPIVDIKAIWSSCIDTGNSIVRNAITLWTPTTAPFHFQFDGWSDIQQHDQDITVAIGTTGGTVILELVKKSGYGNEQFNPRI